LTTPSELFTEDAALFTEYNHTEIFQKARAGFDIAPNLAREALIKILIGQEEPPPGGYDMDEWRRATIRFLLDHRRVLETQIACPAKVLYREPTPSEIHEQIVEQMHAQKEACFGCVDAQVIHCITSNGDNNYQLIRLRKKTSQ
jgi:hypothetical protein